MSKSIFIKFAMSLLVVILISGMFYSSSSYAMGDIISSGKDFLSKGSKATTVIDEGQLKSTSNEIYNTLLAVAIVVAVIVAMILGIQFMWASADEKAKVKEALMPFVVGCVIVFGSFTIWKVAVNIGNKTEGSFFEAGSAPVQKTIIVKKEDGKLYCGSCGTGVVSGGLQSRVCFSCKKGFTNVDEILEQ